MATPAPIRRHAETVSWQESIRNAMYDGVSESDIAEIIRNIVSKAKGGDLKAAEFLFKWTMGQPSVHVKNAAIMVNGSNRPRLRVEPDSPTQEEIALRALDVRKANGHLVNPDLR